VTVADGGERDPRIEAQDHEAVLLVHEETDRFESLEQSVGTAAVEVVGEADEAAGALARGPEAEGAGNPEMLFGHREKPEVLAVVGELEKGLELDRERVLPELLNVTAEGHDEGCEPRHQADSQERLEEGLGAAERPPRGGEEENREEEAEGGP